MFFGDKGIVGVPIVAFGCPETQEAFGSLRIISNELIIGIK